LAAKLASLQLAGELAALYKAYVGRGPPVTRAILHEDLIVVVHEGGITREQPMAHSGRLDLVIAQRRALQELMGPALVTAFETLTGRRVRSMMTAGIWRMDSRAKSSSSRVATQLSPACVAIQKPKSRYPSGHASAPPAIE
jgi:uncharacterized protein YbcI